MINTSTRKKPETDAEPKPQPSVVEAAVEAIREDIKAGRLAPGQRLIESDLCASVGASRTSIREAVGRLQAEGLIEVEHQKGARVRRLTIQDARDLYQVREALEGTAARLAAQNIGKADYRARLKSLEKKFKANADAWSPGIYMQYNEQFHELIVEMSENTRLIRMVAQLQHAAFLMLIQTLSNTSATKKAHEEHDAILAAILDGDDARAERAMRSHVRRTGDDVQARMALYRRS